MGRSVASYKWPQPNPDEEAKQKIKWLGGELEAVMKERDQGAKEIERLQGIIDAKDRKIYYLESRLPFAAQRKTAVSPNLKLGSPKVLVQN
jgi:hypothetical protein